MGNNLNNNSVNNFDLVLGLFQTIDLLINLGQTSNDEIMKELQRQNKEYLEKIIEQNQEIIDMLKEK